MPKTSTVAATIIETSSVQGEQNQIDIGPFLNGPPLAGWNGAAINVAANVSSNSPGIWAMPTSLNVGENNISMTSANALSPLPIYLVISPLQTTAGATLFVQGANTDVGVQVSSVNPSFIPALSPATYNGGAAPNTLTSINPPTVWINASANCQLELGWP